MCQCLLEYSKLRIIESAEKLNGEKVLEKLLDNNIHEPCFFAWEVDAREDKDKAVMISNKISNEEVFIEISEDGEITTFNSEAGVVMLSNFFSEEYSLSKDGTLS